MPNFNWEWKVGPQTVVSLLNLVVMLFGVIIVMTQVRDDINTAKQQIAVMQASIITIQAAQNIQAVNNARIETKMDIVIPKIDKVEDLLRRNFERPK